MACQDPQPQHEASWIRAGTIQLIWRIKSEILSDLAVDRGGHDVLPQALLQRRVVTAAA